MKKVSVLNFQCLGLIACHFQGHLFLLFDLTFIDPHSSARVITAPTRSTDCAHCAAQLAIKIFKCMQVPGKKRRQNNICCTHKGLSLAYSFFYDNLLFVGSFELMRHHVLRRQSSFHSTCNSFPLVGVCDLRNKITNLTDIHYN